MINVFVLINSLYNKKYSKKVFIKSALFVIFEIKIDFDDKFIDYCRDC